MRPINLCEAELAGYVSAIRYNERNKVCNLTVSVDRSYPNGSGNVVEKTSWYTLEAWGKIGKNISKLTKGDNVMFAGILEPRESEDKGKKVKYKRLSLNVGSYFKLSSKMARDAARDAGAAIRPKHHVKVTICGYVGRDVIAAKTGNCGIDVTNLSLSVDRSRLDKDDNRVEKTSWYSIVSWKDTAKKMAELIPGDNVKILGTIEEITSQDNKGTTYVENRIQAYKFHVFSSTKERQALRDIGETAQHSQDNHDNENAEQSQYTQDIGDAVLNEYPYEDLF